MALQILIQLAFRKLFFAIFIFFFFIYNKINQLELNF